MPGWDDRYRSGEHSFREPLHLLVEKESFIAKAAGGRGTALDLASGPGRHALFLAERGWQVLAIDSSAVAIEILNREARDRGLAVETRAENLEQQEYALPAREFDLILDCCYLYRPLFASIRSALRPGGVFLGAIAIAGDDPCLAPMNPAFLLQPGELITHFKEWSVLHWQEGRSGSAPHKRALAELIAQKPSL